MVDRLPKGNDEELTRIFSGSRNEAEVIRGVLESGGIPTVVGHSAGLAYGVTVGPLGQSTVSVAIERVEEAQALLDFTSSDDTEAAVQPRRAGVIKVVSMYALFIFAMTMLLNLARVWMSL